MKRRLDVRRMLLARGWEESPSLVLHRRFAHDPTQSKVTVSVNGSDVFVTGVTRRAVGYLRDTVSIPSGVPARVIVALCEEWAR